MRVCVGAILVNTATGEHQLFMHEIPTFLQSLERNSAECFGAAIKHVWDSTSIAQFEHLFERVLELNGLDSAASNRKYDKWRWRCVGFAGANVLTLWCFTHRKHNAAAALYKLAPPLVSGVIAYGVAQRPKGAVELLTLCIACFLATRLQYHKDVQPDRAGPVHRQREALFDIIFGDESSRAKPQNQSRNLRYCLTRSFMHGNLCKKRFHHCCVGQHCPDESACRTACRTTLAPTLVNSALTLFEKHKWIGAEETLREAQVSLLPYGMGKFVLPVWVGCMREAREPVASDFELSADDSSSIESGSNADDQDYVDGFQPPVSAEAEDLAEEQAPRPATDHDWKAFNNRMQGKAQTLLGSYRNAWRLAVLSLIAAPLAHMLNEDLKLNSRLDDMETMAAHLSGQGSDDIGMTRIDRVCSLDDVNKCLDSLQRIIFDFRFDAIPSAQRTVSLSTFGFRLASRGGAATSAHVKEPTQACPFTLLQVKTAEQAAAWLKATPLCLRDQFSQRHVEWYPGGLLGSRTSLVILWAVRFLGIASVMFVECRHAATRRWVHSASNSKIKSLVALSALFILRNQRRTTYLPMRQIQDAQNQESNCKMHKATARKMAALRKHAEKRLLAGKQLSWRLRKRLKHNDAHHRSGGAWRVFVHQKFKEAAAASGQSFGRVNRNMFVAQKIRDLSHQYRAIKAANGREWLELRRMGRMWTVAAKENGNTTLRKRRMRSTFASADPTLLQIANVPAVSTGLSSTLCSILAEVQRGKVVEDHSRQLKQQQVIEFQHAESTKLAARLPVQLRPLGAIENCVAVPGAVVDGTLVAITKCAHSVRDLVEHALASAPEATLLKGQQELTDFHTTIMSADQAPYPRMASETTICQRAGFCLHSKRGGAIAILEARMIAQLQMWAPPKSACRSALVGAWLAIRLRKRGGNKEYFWFHLAFQNLSLPWTVQLLQLVQDRSARAALVAPHIALKAQRDKLWANAWRTLWDCVRDFRFGYAMELYCLQTPQRFITTLRPSDYLEVATVRGEVDITEPRSGNLAANPPEAPSNDADVHQDLADADVARGRPAPGDDVVGGPDDAGAGAGDAAGAGLGDEGGVVSLDPDCGIAESHGIWSDFGDLVSCGALGVDPSALPDLDNDDLDELAQVVALKPDEPVPAPDHGDAPGLGPAPSALGAHLALPDPGPAAAGPAAPVLGRDERLIDWPGVNRWKLSENHTMFDGIKQHTGFILRCMCHSNDYDAPSLSSGMPQCRISLTFKTKRPSWIMTEQEARVRVKFWAARTLS